MAGKLTERTEIEPSREPAMAFSVPPLAVEGVTPMLDLVLVARLLLAAIFLAAAVFKLSDLSSFRRTLLEFGAPKSAIELLVATIPITELLIAFALTVLSTAWYAALIASGLLVLFTAAILVNISLGRRPACRCFGQLSAKPIGWLTVGRNFLLIVISGIIVWFAWDNPILSAFDWVTMLTLGQRILTTGLVLALVIAILEAWLLIQILGQQGRLLLRLDAIESRLGYVGTTAAPARSSQNRSAPSGIPVGWRAPSFEVNDLNGRAVALESFLAKGKRTLLAFTDPACGPCNSLLPHIGRWQQELANTTTLVVVSRGSAHANRANAAKYHLEHVLLQTDHEVADLYKINSTPSMVLIRADGTIGGATALGPQAISEVMNELSAGSSPANGEPQVTGAADTSSPHHEAPAIGQPAVGQQAPATELPDLDGKVTRLDSFRGDNTLLLFWNPRCPFCVRMIEPLKAWEAHRPKGSPRLVFISTGLVEENRIAGFNSPVLLQRGFETATQFGVTSTPSAILLDSEAAIASNVGRGASDILRLMQKDSQKMLRRV